MSSEPFTAFHQALPPEEEDRIASLLRLHLAREEISSRAGAGSARFSYLATSKAVELANYIFGHDGWSSSIQDVTIDFLEESKEGRWNVGVSCIMRVTLRGGSYHEDVGYGQTVNMPGRAEALEKAKKESCSDGLKRAMRLFGNKLGNSLSDQQYMTALKSGKGQKEPLDLTQSPRKRIKLEHALNASTQPQPPPHNNNNNIHSHNNSLSHVPQSPSAESYPVSPQQPYQPPPSVSPNKPVSPHAAGTSLNTSPAAGPPTAGLAAYNRQPAPSPPVAAASASFPYKPRMAPNAPPRPLPGKENAVGGGGVGMDTSGNAPLPSIHGIIHSLPAAAHAAATAPYSSIAYSPPVKQEAAIAAASYGPPSAAASSYATNHAQSTYTAARPPYGQASAQPAALPDAAMPPPHTAVHAAYAPAGATFPSVDTGGGFIAHDAGSATAPPALAGGSFFGADDDDSGGFISQWLTHNGPAGGQSTGGTAAAVSNNA